MANRGLKGDLYSEISNISMVYRIFIFHPIVMVFVVVVE
jgi:hypothetical protein